MDLDALLRASEAAAYFRCHRQRIQNWRSGGYLQPADTDAHGRPQYRLGDLIKAEKTTRRHPKSHRSSLAFA